ncbi:MAG: glutaminase A [Actinobacteria bacterium]|nr:glutaminase A [Actinomycetota bacterium]
MEHPTAPTDDDATRQRSPVQQYIDRLHLAHCRLDGGDVATYIPELGKADPDWFAIAIATMDGQVYAAGDTDVQFTIQSISKPFVYGMALDDRGADFVLERVGVEPTGDPFNSITVDEESNRPFNPMVNAGAIATTGLLRGGTAEAQWQRIASGFAAFTGSPMTVDEGVFGSENVTGDRNRAIAYLMRNFGMIDGDVDEVLELYFRQCSLLVTATDLAVAAATLAAGGRNPVTGQRAIKEQHVANVLSVMQTCGMYDFAGSWTYDVGLPAKSGVSGGVIAVLPGQLGIAVFSPPLDKRGNSVRGIEVCRRIVRDFDLHPLRTHEAAQTDVISRRYDGRSVRSTRTLTLSECDTIEQQAHRLEVFELHGRLVFADAEQMLRAVLAVAPAVDTIILEGHRLAGIDPPAVPLIHGLARSLAASGQTLVLASFPPTDDAGKALVFDAERYPDLDVALESWEDRMLAEVLGPRDQVTVPLSEQELLRGLSAEAIAAVEGACTIGQLDTGAALAREGQDADSVFFLLSGRVSVWLRLPEQRHGRRLASFGAGVAVGEMALLESSTRSADLVLEAPSTVAELRVDELDALEREHPGLKATVYANLAQTLSDRLRRANGRIRALEQ